MGGDQRQPAAMFPGSRPVAARELKLGNADVSEEMWVHCGAHGKQPAAFVCKHLVDSVNSGRRVGWCRPESNELHAWCEACEAVRRQEGEWNDRSEGFASVTMVCSACYDRARQINELTSQGT
jgi:hypothetical protein